MADIGGKSRGKKDGILTKLKKKRPPDNDCSDETNSPSGQEDKPSNMPNIPGSKMAGSRSMVVQASNVSQTGQKVREMSQTQYHPPQKGSRAAEAIHGPNDATPVPVTNMKTHEEHRQAPSANIPSTDTDLVVSKRNDAVPVDSATGSSNPAEKAGAGKSRVGVLENEKDVTKSRPKMDTPNADKSKSVKTTSDTVETPKISKDSDTAKSSPKTSSKTEPSTSSKVESPANSATTNETDNAGDKNPVQNNAEVLRESPEVSKEGEKDNAYGATSSTAAPPKSPHSKASKSPVKSKVTGKTTETSDQVTRVKEKAKKSNSAGAVKEPSQKTPPSKSDETGKAKPRTADDKKESRKPRAMFVKATDQDIASLDVDLVVSSEDGALQGYGMVAKRLDGKGGDQYTGYKRMTCNILEFLDAWQFVLTPGTGSLKCKSVAHVHVPRMAKQDQITWCTALAKMLGTLMKRVDCMGFTSMAIPLLGTGRNGAPADLVIDLLCREILEVSEAAVDKFWLQTIYIVHPEQKIVKDVDKKINDLHLPKAPDLTQTPDVPKQGRKPKKPSSDVIGKSFVRKYAVTSSMEKNTKLDETCPICMDDVDPKERVELGKCHHVFCLSCIEQSFKVKSACPLCNIVYGEMRGIQPPGCMFEVFREESLPGFLDCGSIHIYYSFLDGAQGVEHPNPGKRYKGAKREAFLPDNREGQRVHRLLRKCFDQRLTFTIGSSRTTGREGVVTWNDVHHKTRVNGGPPRFGYPDPTYLGRVEAELADKGISEE